MHTNTWCHSSSAFRFDFIGVCVSLPEAWKRKLQTNADRSLREHYSTKVTTLRHYSSWPVTCSARRETRLVDTHSLNEFSLKQESAELSILRNENYMSLINRWRLALKPEHTDRCLSLLWWVEVDGGVTLLISPLCRHSSSVSPVILWSTDVNWAIFSSSSGVLAIIRLYQSPQQYTCTDRLNSIHTHLHFCANIIYPTIKVLMYK